MDPHVFGSCEAPEPEPDPNEEKQDPDLNKVGSDPQDPHPQAKKTKLTKPDKTVYCPISRQPLRVKDLVDVQWTETRDPDDKKKLIAREERYHCAVTGDILNNASQCAVIKTTGHVVTKDCVEKIIKKVGNLKFTSSKFSVQI